MTKGMTFTQARALQEEEARQLKERNTMDMPKTEFKKCIVDMIKSNKRGIKILQEMLERIDKL